MGIRRRLRDAIRGRRTVTQESARHLRIDALCSSYENLFAQVQAYIDEMDVVIPYGVGRNGARLPASRTPELAVLQSPNDDMDWTAFIDTCFATWLTESELNIHVWKTGRGGVDGYTILPPNCRREHPDGSVSFHVFSTAGGYEDLEQSEVMTLRFSRSPRNVSRGVSPASAVEGYAQLDDLMAQLQKARFENGAFPDTITTIRAQNRDQFEATRAKMEKGYQGAQNKHKTLFLWRQSLDDGTTADEVEIKPVSAPNSTLALGELNKIITDRLNKSFRVSSFILGDDSSAKYDNAELSQARFVEKCIYPALRRFWSQFQHELDRVVGGLGYAISFDLSIPELTDRAKTRAEIMTIRSSTLANTIAAGASPQAAVRALELGDEWLPVARGIYLKTLSDGSTHTTSTLPKADNRPSDCHSQLCNHEHKQYPDTLLPERTTDDTGNEETYKPDWDENETVERKIYDLLMELAERIAAEDPNINLQELKDAITELLMSKADDGADTGAKKIQALAIGEENKAEIAAILENDGYHLSEDFHTRLSKRTETLVNQFDEDTRTAVREVFTTGGSKSASQLKSELSQALPRHRAETIARNETVYAFKSGRLENDRYLAQRYGLKMNLVWRTSRDSDVCPACAAMNGMKTPLGESFQDSVIAGEALDKRQLEEYKLKPTDILAWEHSQWNNEGRIPNAHVNCRCYFDEVIE